MKILAIGDVVGKNGCAFLRSRLRKFKEDNRVDFVIANGENSAEGNGMLPGSVGYLFDSGVDVITSGNHAFRRKEIFSFLDDNSYEKNGKYILRPYNYPSKNTPGKGICKGIKKRDPVTGTDPLHQTCAHGITSMWDPSAVFSTSIREGKASFNSERCVMTRIFSNSLRTAVIASASLARPSSS